jgi:DNA-binding Lrp family transcriptional regulator
MEELELELVSELMRNSRRSDRELAKALGVSQPTITRTRTKLEKTGLIREYTMIPNFEDLGFEIMALTFFRWLKSCDDQEFAKVMEAGTEMHRRKGLPVFMVVRGLGSNGDFVIISIHESYSAYQKYLDDIKTLPFSDGCTITDVLVNLRDGSNYRRLTFISLAEYINGKTNSRDHRKRSRSQENPKNLESL